MTRALLLLTAGIGFLTLLAYSWTPDPGAERGSAPETPRAPASTQATAAGAEAQRPHARERKAESLREIGRLERCYEDGGCAFPKTDPRSYGLAVASALAAALAAHQAEFGPDPALARAGLLSHEPAVQVAALKMLAALEPSAESLSWIETGLRHTPDPSLVADAMKELARHLGTDQESYAQRIVESFVAKGAHFSAQQAAAMVLPFINERSYAGFRGLLERLERGAETRKFLEIALREYELRRQGG